MNSPFFSRGILCVTKPTSQAAAARAGDNRTPLTHTHTHKSWISGVEGRRLIGAVMIPWWMDWAGCSSIRLDHFLKQNTLSLCKTALTVGKWQNSERVLVNSLICKTRSRPLICSFAKDVIHNQSRYCCYYILGSDSRPRTPEFTTPVHCSFQNSFFHDLSAGPWTCCLHTKWILDVRVISLLLQQLGVEERQPVDVLWM